MNQKPHTVLEVCVDSYASAMAAVRGGADRLELCSALALGGLTPWTELLAQLRAVSDITIRCLMRPRAGDFLYSQEEIDLLCAQIKALHQAGADGFVIGALQADGELDTRSTARLCEAADGAGLTLHRAIDVSAAANCLAGRETIGKLLALRDEIGGPEILIGAGVNAAVITELRRDFPTARAFHMSGKTEVESAMQFRRQDVPMGLPGLDEWHLQYTSEEYVRAARLALDASFSAQN